MNWNLFQTLFLLAMAPSVSLAQTPSPAQDGRAGAPAASGSAYKSAFADYKPYTEPVVMSWREANDKVRDTGGMRGHDMATMKSQSEDPHAGHDMSKMRANPAAPAGPGVGSSADEAGASHAAQGAKKAQPADPHAGHDMSQMGAPARQDVPGATDKANHGSHSAPANQPTNKREKE